MICDQCYRRFEARPHGGHRQRFCTPWCREQWQVHLAKRKRADRLLAVLIKRTPEPQRSVYVEQRRLAREVIDALKRQQHAPRVLS